MIVKNFLTSTNINEIGKIIQIGNILYRLYVLAKYYL